jgi:hypothetical protein
VDNLTTNNTNKHLKKEKKRKKIPGSGTVVLSSTGVTPLACSPVCLDFLGRFEAGTC